MNWALSCCRGGGSKILLNWFWYYEIIVSGEGVGGEERDGVFHLSSYWFLRLGRRPMCFKQHMMVNKWWQGSETVTHPGCFRQLPSHMLFLAADLLVLANSNMNSMTVQRRRYAAYSSCQIKIWKEIQDDLAHIIAGLLRITRLLLRTVRKRVYFGTTFDHGALISVFSINPSRIWYLYLVWFLTFSSFDLCD